ncbi:UNVERIFIED_CONTAM: hypothetical protein K2H54_044934 [Gekko kuhli]
MEEVAKMSLKEDGAVASLKEEAVLDWGETGSQATYIGQQALAEQQLEGVAEEYGQTTMPLPDNWETLGGRMELEQALESGQKAKGGPPSLTRGNGTGGKQGLGPKSNLTPDSNWARAKGFWELVGTEAQ